MRVRIAAGLAALCAVLAAPAGAQVLMDKPPAPARDLDIEERVGAQLPLDAEFTNSEGRAVRLGDYFPATGGKPAVIALVYYRCPVVCSVVMEKLTESVQALDLTTGKDFNLLVFSFNPNESVPDARTRREGFLASYNREVTAQVRAGWQFHVSGEESVGALARGLGFTYRKLDNGEYSHPVCIFVVTPQGKVSRYFYGFSYPARDLKLALIEASEGKGARTIGERLASYCYVWDPSRGGYALKAVRVMQVAGIVTVVSLGGLIGLLVAGERLRRGIAARRREVYEPNPRIVPALPAGQLQSNDGGSA